ncbi:hypothetical protein [Amycolatopsis sp. H20-H5]|uniref:hypothetical protein n=1 Tax=Amycolatopsis sp. H20-H5 TaxID=3046309 RepID=UPI002DB68754|nr:hypothetical protein [Amycolatopsis sp. H20-H5]MEC3979622.1 hypothetical protein [Amycolatopsis sp. H20-H5]
MVATLLVGVRSAGHCFVNMNTLYGVTGVSVTGVCTAPSLHRGRRCRLRCR